MRKHYYYYGILPNGKAEIFRDPKYKHWYSTFLMGPFNSIEEADAESKKIGKPPGTYIGWKHCPIPMKVGQYEYELYWRCSCWGYNMTGRTNKQTIERRLLTCEHCHKTTAAQEAYGI